MSPYPLPEGVASFETVYLYLLVISVNVYSSGGSRQPDDSVDRNRLREVPGGAVPGRLLIHRGVDASGGDEF